VIFKYYLDDQIKKDEMGWACSTYGEGDGYIQGFGGEPRKKRPLEKLGLCGIILNWIFKK
jgi:hypothetical protein